VDECEPLVGGAGGAVRGGPRHGWYHPEPERAQDCRRRCLGGQGGAVQADAVKTKLKLPGNERLKLTCDILLSTSTFKFTLRSYTKGVAAAAAGGAVEAGGYVLHCQLCEAGPCTCFLVISPSPILVPRRCSS